MVNEKPTLTFGSGQLPTPNVQRRAMAPQISGNLKNAGGNFAALLSQAAPQTALPAGEGREEPAAAPPPNANFSTPVLKNPLGERARRITTPVTGRGGFEMIDTRHGPGANLPALNSPQHAPVRRQLLDRVMEDSAKPLAVVNSLPEQAAASMTGPEHSKNAFRAPKVLTPPSRRGAPPAEVFSFNSPFAVGPSARELVSIFHQVNAGRPEPDLAAVMGLTPSAGSPPGSAEMGSLSARYESGSEGIAAIGYDRHGGTSYGKYQISSRAGTMKRFLDYLDTRAPDLSSRLRAAGPANTGGRSGSMPTTWKQIAAEDPTRFEALQGDFIRDSHYEPALEAMAGSTGLTYASIPPALQEVLFSTAVQHGPAGASGIISRAVAKVGAHRLQAAAGEEEMTRASRELIREIYNARAGKFGSSTKEVRASVQQRLRQEMRDALAMLD